MTAILFDLDGTLLDTLADLTDATNYALRQFGYPERTTAQVRRAVGNGVATLIHKSLPEGTDGEIAQQVLEVFRHYYADHCQVKTCPYAGIPEALETLGKKYPLAIVSNKPDGAVKELCKSYFPGYYALGETPDCPRKPAADMVYKAMKAIGADRCVYVGDSEVDILTAKNAAVPCVSVLWGFRDREEMAAVGETTFCQTPEKLTEIIEELIHGK